MSILTKMTKKCSAFKNDAQERAKKYNILLHHTLDVVAVEQYCCYTRPSRRKHHVDDDDTEDTMSKTCCI
jgi:hypothetical protein